MSARAANGADLPAWPAMLDAPLACAYTSLGTEAFRSLMQRHGVRPVDLGNSSIRWRRADIDAVIDKLPIRPSVLERDALPEQPSLQVLHLTDPAQAGLERARRRARG